MQCEKLKDSKTPVQVVVSCFELLHDIATDTDVVSRPTAPIYVLIILFLRKKRGVELFAITSLTVNRFWKFFHC